MIVFCSHIITRKLAELLMPKIHGKYVNGLAQKMSNSVLNIEFVVWPERFILDQTHELSTWI